MFFDDPARTSTLVLTGLIMIGLVFFIRASTKDRIEVAQFGSLQEADALQKTVVKYFYSRAYQPAGEADTLSGQADDKKAARKAKKEAVIAGGTTMKGLVSPSVFLAVFLSVLAAIGFASLGLIVATLFPAWGGWLLALVAASPLAGVFYWKKSSRPETVVFRVDALAAGEAIAEYGTEDIEAETAETWRSKLTVKGHRDELADLENVFAQPELRSLAGLAKIRQG